MAEGGLWSVAARLEVEMLLDMRLCALGPVELAPGRIEEGMGGWSPLGLLGFGGEAEPSPMREKEPAPP